MKIKNSKILIVGLVALLVGSMAIITCGAGYESVDAPGETAAEGWQIISQVEDWNATICVTIREEYKVNKDTDPNEVRFPTGEKGLDIRVHGLQEWGHGHDMVWVKVVELDTASGPNKMGYDSGKLHEGFEFTIYPGENEVDATAEVAVKITNTGDLSDPQATLRFNVNLQWW